jgi:hypothetical protein
MSAVLVATNRHFSIYKSVEITPGVCNNFNRKLMGDLTGQVSSAPFKVGLAT